MPADLDKLNILELEGILYRLQRHDCTSLRFRRTDGEMTVKYCDGCAKKAMVETELHRRHLAEQKAATLVT